VPPTPRPDPSPEKHARRGADGPGGRGQPIGGEEFAAVFARWKAAIREAMAPHSGKPGARAAAGGEPPWALVGIKRRGAVLARRLWQELNTAEHPLLYGEVDISLYRDDYHLNRAKPEVLGTEIAFAVDGVRILLVDDVLYTGRTVRAAMDLILDFGRPRAILLAVFVDRGHRELPIAANVVGKEIATAPADEVRVRLRELGEQDSVELIPGAPDGAR
jgi:pyrimidine operon attenuation protein/uracil phosphoribosyltransferase